jgi:rubrerythrin
MSPETLSPEASRLALIGVLRHAYSGELAAAYAYDGHARSVSDPAEKAEIRRIHDDELDHRDRVGRMLAALGAAPDPRLERVMALVGGIISRLCLVGGWVIPMYGAGRLEAGNIGEYETAARLAAGAGRSDLVDSLLDMAEVEWDHEAYFRAKVGLSVWRSFLPAWPVPGPRERIRGRP